jgi:GrpB-like predicted nucleotidyltransferase (UPF0157 family)
MKILIQEHQESWTIEFSNLMVIIQNALRPFTNTTIEHIGSTSVAGLNAKPIIDILVGIEKAGFLDKIVSPMQEAGFTYSKKYELSWPERRYFLQLTPISTKSPPLTIDIGDDDSFRQYFISKAHVHIVVKATHDWKRHIAFRDFLRTHPDFRERYDQLKKKLSEKEFRHHLKYYSRKNDFVKEIERKALVWYDQIQTKKNNPLSTE